MSARYRVVAAAIVRTGAALAYGGAIHDAKAVKVGQRTSDLDRKI